jgi:hypothetical protein
MSLDLEMQDLLDVGVNSNGNSKSSDGFKESIKNKSSSLGDLTVDLMSEVNTTIAILLFVFYLLINSSPFLFNVIPSYMEGTQISQEGILIQAGMVSLFYIIISILYDAGCI